MKARDFGIGMLALAAAVCLLATGAGAGVLEYEYDAAADTAGNANWEDEQGTSPGRNWTFNSGSASPKSVTSAGTSFTMAYDFKGGGVSDPDYAKTSTFENTPLDTTGNGAHSPVAWEMWIKPHDTSYNQVLFESGGNTRGCSMLLEGSILSYNTIGDPTDTKRASYDIGSPPSDFLQVVGVTDKVLGQTRLYIDGALKAATGGIRRWNAGTDGAGLANANNAVGGLTGGAQTAFKSGGLGGSDVSFDGEIARVAFYSGDTTLADVQQQYLAGGGDLGLTPGTTLGVSLNYDASLDDDGNRKWEDTIGTAGGTFDWSLSSGVARTTAPDASAHPGISHAYVFGGSDKGTMTTLEKVVSNPTDASASFEIWFRPADLDDIGTEVLFETGGNVDGLSFTLDGSVLRFKAKNQGQNAEATFDLLALTTHPFSRDPYEEFIQAVGVVDLEVDHVLLYVNGQYASAASATGTPFKDWAGGDGSGLAGVNGTLNTNGGAFDGEIAILRFYDWKLSSSDVRESYTAVSGIIIPEPATLSLLALGALGLLARRRKP